MASSSNNGTLNQHHVAPVFFYVMVFLGLIVGTVLTVVVAKFDLGPLNNIVMLAVAMAKALLVVLFFMHVRWASRLTWVVAASGLFWLLILFTLTMADYMSRGWVEGTLR
jgi:cytochrome c oxidase subunit 4